MPWKDYTETELSFFLSRRFLESAMVKGIGLGFVMLLRSGGFSVS